MISIKLIEPSHKYPVGVQSIGIPLGLLYLISYLQKTVNDVSVELVSLRMKDVLRESYSLEKEIGNADIVATTSITSNFDTAIEVLEMAKKNGSITVIGGIFPTYNADWIMKKFTCVDYLIRGDGEISFAGLVQVIKERKKPFDVAGLSWRHDGNILHNRDADLANLHEIPSPAYDMLNMEQYQKIAPGSIYSIRGCSWSCRFCSLSPFRKNHALFLELDKVIDELRILRNYGFTKIRIEDETATLNRARSVEMFKRIANANLGLEFNIKTRIDVVDQELLQLLWDAGVRQIKYGLEVPDESSLKEIRKGIHLSEIDHVLEMSLKTGFKVAGVYVLGWPGVEPKDLNGHYRFINKWGNVKNFITMFTFITPHPGTPLWEDAQTLGLEILTNNLSRYTHKHPVAVPTSFGANGLKLLVDMYHDLAISTNSVTYNPRVNIDYLAELGYPVSQEHNLANIQENKDIGDCCV